ncbi:MAG TPA: hypothetical protein VHE30_22120 [Polyangiaceae bacterium]|nr:hypothetical protein [Polyangiaceae bacterium]
MRHPVRSAGSAIGVAVLAASCGNAPPRNGGQASAAQASGAGPAGAEDAASTDRGGARGTEPPPPGTSTGRADRASRSEGEHPLPVAGWDAALVSFPPETASPLPLLFVAHGAKDLPGAQCAVFRSALGNRGTVVCLVGPRADVKAEPRYFPDHPTLEKILIATRTSFLDAYGAPPGGAPSSAAYDVPAVYVGYSQGATMGALVLPSHARQFPKALFVEGGFGEWTAARAEEFVHGGGTRVAFVCGTKKCAEEAPTSARLLHRAGAETRVLVDLRSGHEYGPYLVRKIEDAVAWLTLPAAP